MKKVLVLIVMFFVVSMAFSQGIEFFHGTWEQACEKAAKEKKNLFVDVYTSWCGPCKLMARNVFTQKIVGDYFNKNFVSVKLDAEKDTDSKFFEKFKASSFPSFFWVSSDEKLLDTKVGGSSAEQLIKDAENALKYRLGEKAILLEKRWNDGERTMEIVNEYLFKVLPIINPQAVKPNVCEYLKGLSEEELRSKETLSIIKKYIRMEEDVDGIIFQTFLKNIKYYAEYESTSDCTLTGMWKNMYIRFVRVPSASLVKANKSARRGIDTSEFTEEYNKSIEKVRNLDFMNKEMFIACQEFEKLLYASSNYSEGIIRMEEILIKYGEAYPYLYGELLYSLTFSNYFIEGKAVDGEKVLAIAESFLKKVPNQQSMLYYAATLYNLKRYDEAVSTMAWLPFYPQPTLSNAYYKYFGFENIRQKFPYN